MRVTYDPKKREKVLAERGLDFDDAPLIFGGVSYQEVDDRRNYGEVRFLTVGFLRGRLMMLVWTPRSDARHIISMRKCNEREQKRYARHLGRS
jgi:uncharacterized protein